MGMDHVAETIVSLRDDVGSVHIFALADGAGSSVYGGASAQLATKAFIHKLEELFQFNIFLSEETVKTHMFKAFEHARSVIFSNLINDDHVGSPSKCHTTLIGACIVLYNNAETNPLVCFAGVGDGVVICKCGNDNADGKYFESILPITKGEYENQTMFLTSEDWGKVWFFRTVQDCQAFFIASDGLNHIYYEEKPESELDNVPYYKRFQWEVIPIEKYLDKLLNQLPNWDSQILQNEFLTNPKLMEINDDDKSLILGLIEEDVEEQL
jgi:hypothetical protein